MARMYARGQQERLVSNNKYTLLAWGTRLLQGLGQSTRTSMPVGVIIQRTRPSDLLHKPPQYTGEEQLAIACKCGLHDQTTTVRTPEPGRLGHTCQEMPAEPNLHSQPSSGPELDQSGRHSRGVKRYKGDNAVGLSQLTVLSSSCKA